MSPEKLANVLLTSVLKEPEGTSWKDLNDKLVARLKKVLIAGTVLFTILVALAAYLLLVPTAVQNPSQLVSDLGQVFTDATALTKGFGALVFSVVLYLYGKVVIDLGKAHYRLDKKTFNLLGKVNDYIAVAIKEESPCRDADDCSYDHFLNTVDRAQRRLMREVFYEYANRDQVDSWNQAEKRRDVFDKWAEYYMTNILMLLLLVLLVSLGSLSVISEVVTGAWVLLWILPIGLAVAWWRRVGSRHERIVCDHAEDQVRAFFRHDRGGITNKLRALTGPCPSEQCNL